MADIYAAVDKMIFDNLPKTPVPSAPVAEKLTGAHRAAVQRNLGQFSRRGLVREITGQQRYRFWTVKA